MEKILDNIDKSMNIIISLFTIYNLIRGFWLNKNKKQLEKQREDLQKNCISKIFQTTIIYQIHLTLLYIMKQISK